jgi:hypothetical protein
MVRKAQRACLLTPHPLSLSPCQRRGEDFREAQMEVTNLYSDASKGRQIDSSPLFRYFEERF